jgi:hypothetical protein
LSEATHPLVIPSIGIVVVLGLVPCTPKVDPHGVGSRHQLYAALSGLTSKGRKRRKEAALVSYAAAAAEYKEDISIRFPTPKLSTQLGTT